MSKVMLAEDDQTMVSLLKTLLRMEGFEVLALEGDADIPAAVRQESPDVLLLDVHLENQNGLEALDAIRSSDATRATRIVMTSGLNLKAECMARGADDFLLKPYMPDELIGMLKRNIRPA